MAVVKLSNCGHDENGRYAGGKAGDQTGTEYQIINWYNRPWLCVLRFEDKKIAVMIADMAKKAAEIAMIAIPSGNSWPQMATIRQKLRNHAKQTAVRAQQVL